MSQIWNVREGEPVGSGYTLTDRIGAGAMGQVWRAADRDGEPVAIKILRTELAGDAGVVNKFLQERQLLQRVAGPNVVAVRDLVAEGSNLAIVMDLVDGHDLRAELVRRGTFTPADAALLLSGVLNGLAAVHAAGIVHADIKPENILLDGATPRISDFGVSRFVEEAATTTSTVIGTPEYLAPEVADGSSPTITSDLYAVGIMAYELLCGVTPFAGGSPLAVLRRHVEQAPTRPAGIPDPLWELIDGLISKNPDDRPTSAAMTRAALGSIAASLAGLPAARKLDAPPPPTVLFLPTMTVAHAAAPGAAAAGPAPSGRKRWVWVAAAAAALLVLGGGTAVALSMRSKQVPAAAAAVDTPSETPTQSDTPSPTVTPTPTPTVNTVPAVTGLQVARATTLLAGEGLTPTIGEVVDDTQTDGIVTIQDPAAGAPFPADSKVTLTVARRSVATNLDDLSPVQQDGYNDGNHAGTAVVNGKSYTRAVSFAVQESTGYTYSVQYDLGRDYQTFTATVGLSDASASNATVRLEVLADNRSVYSKDFSLGQTDTVKIDVSGALRLDFKVTLLTKADQYSTLVMGDPQLFGLPGVVPTPSPTPTY